MNPYVGLTNYSDWEDIGIESGKLEGDVFKASDSSLYFAVKHLNKNIRKTKIFTSEVFTDEILQKLNVKMAPVFGFNAAMDDDYDTLSALINDGITENSIDNTVETEIMEDED